MKLTRPDTVIVTCLCLKLFSRALLFWFQPPRASGFLRAASQTATFMRRAICLWWVCFWVVIVIAIHFHFFWNTVKKHSKSTSKSTQRKEHWSEGFCLKPDNLKIIRANLLFIPHCQVSIKQKHKGLWEWGISDTSLLNLTEYTQEMSPKVEKSWFSDFFCFHSVQVICSTEIKIKVQFKNRKKNKNRKQSSDLTKHTKTWTDAAVGKPLAQLITLLLLFPAAAG